MLGPGGLWLDENGLMLYEPSPAKVGTHLCCSIAPASVWLFGHRLGLTAAAKSSRQVQRVEGSCKCLLTGSVLECGAAGASTLRPAALLYTCQLPRDRPQQPVTSTAREFTAVAVQLEHWPPSRTSSSGCDASVSALPSSFAAAKGASMAAI